LDHFFRHAIHLNDWSEFPRPPLIFKPFWRGPHAVSGGAGLGLAIVDRAQRAQGGGVFVKTPEADGATFVLTYPSAD